MTQFFCSAPFSNQLFTQDSRFPSVHGWDSYWLPMGPVQGSVLMLGHLLLFRTESSRLRHVTVMSLQSFLILSLLVSAGIIIPKSTREETGAKANLRAPGGDRGEKDSMTGRVRQRQLPHFVPRPFQLVTK